MIPRRSSADSCPGLRSEARRSSVARSMYPLIAAIIDSFDFTTQAGSEVIGAPFHGILLFARKVGANRDPESQMKVERRRRVRNCPRRDQYSLTLCCELGVATPLG